MKKILALVLTLVMLLSVMPLAIFAAGNPFTDVPEGAYYYDAVMWAYRSGITTGTTKTKFAPASTTTRGQVVTFLWRALGEPEPETTVNPFEDVKASDYYYKPILWAVEKGITNGTSAKRFSPDVTCTNAHILTFIWRAMGEPEKTSSGEWYEDAVNWANAYGMTEGTFEGTFNPKAECPRSNVVTYLYKYDAATSTTLRVFVAADGDDKTADGTASKPFGTITAARDYVRTLDKSAYTEIEVRIGAGEYQIKEPIVLTAADSGTKDCEIRYIGEKGAAVIGGIKLTAKDFVKASGGLTKYFPEEVRDQIVMVDLNKYGYTSAMMQKALTGGKLSIAGTVPFLSLNGNRQTIAEFPNNSFIHVGKTITHSKDGTTNTAVDCVDRQTIYYGEEYHERVLSWSNVQDIYVIARLFKLWCPDDSRVVARGKDEATIDILFAGGHEPDEGTILKFYNIPEELDVPGEYIYDENSVLYYYPAEGFDSGILTIPLSDGLLTLKDTSYVSFENIAFTSANGDALTLNGNHISILNCDISAAKEDGIVYKADNLTIEGCSVHDIGEDGITGTSGNIANITGGNLKIYNNDVYEFSVTRPYGYGITAHSSVNVQIAHNDVHDANFKAIDVSSCANAVIEYNHVWNLSRFSDDTGAVGAGGMQNANVVVRYNYVHDLGPVGEAAKILDYNPDYHYMGAFAFYYDNGTSYTDTYGNVAMTCDNGYLSNGGRHNTCHNNIFINCHSWYVWFSEFMYSGQLDSKGNISGSTRLDDYVYSAAWQKANAELSKLILKADASSKNNPLLYSAPAFNECYENVIVYNKNDRTFTNWGIRPYNIEGYAKQFSPAIVMDGDSVKSSSLETYSSKRTEIDIEEIVEKYSDVLGLTLDQFRTIGRIEK